jgi:deoxyribodipyrimidine photo-lyase
MPKTAAAPPPHAYALHWFRRDLRTAGNPALQAAWKEHDGRVVGFFCFDSKFLARPDFSANRFGLFLATLEVLRDELRGLGGDLLVLDVGPREAFPKLLKTLADRKIALPKTVTFNRDYEPFARARDADVERLLVDKFGVAVHTERDHLLIEPEELVREGRGPKFYQVFTPFSRRWFERFASDEVQQRIAVQKKALSSFRARLQGRSTDKPFHLTWSDVFGGAVPMEDQLDRYVAKNKPKVNIALPPVGTAAAIDRLKVFEKSTLDDYAATRDVPSISGTSQMSIYLKNGAVTTAQVVAALDLAGARIDKKKAPTDRDVFVKELAWREFYYHILYHRPDVESGAFLERYRELKWDDNEAFFDAWKAGKTGYPIVDAGMRQLSETGWMHNRVRMIVASFLTKDLLIDWRWGERHFMELLLDGDLAANNGGWQWAASTGCDPQPYFRIFNPKLQGEKFDPDGDYVRRWVPELRDVPTKFIHAPHDRPEARGYVRPIVDHAEQKAKALALYQAT